MVSKEMAPQIGWLDDYIVHLLLLPLSREMGDGSKFSFEAPEASCFVYIPGGPAAAGRWAMGVDTWLTSKRQ